MRSHLHIIIHEQNPLHEQKVTCASITLSHFLYGGELIILDLNDTAIIKSSSSSLFIPLVALWFSCYFSMLKSQGVEMTLNVGRPDH